MSTNHNKTIESLLTKFAAARTKQSDGPIYHPETGRPLDVRDHSGWVDGTIGSVVNPLGPGGVLRTGLSGSSQYMEDPNASLMTRGLDTLGNTAASGYMGYLAGRGAEWTRNWLLNERLRKLGLDPNATFRNSFYSDPTAAMTGLGLSRPGITLTVDNSGRVTPRGAFYRGIEASPLSMATGFGYLRGPSGASTSSTLTNPTQSWPWPTGTTPTTTTQPELLMGRALNIGDKPGLHSVTLDGKGGYNPVNDPRVTRSTSGSPARILVNNLSRNEAAARPRGLPRPGLVERAVNTLQDLFNLNKGTSVLNVDAPLAQNVANSTRAMNIRSLAGLGGAGLGFALSGLKGYSGYGELPQPADGTKPLDNPAIVDTVQRAVNRGTPINDIPSSSIPSVKLVR